MNHKYTSQELDSETGLYNYDARLYNPVLARFISPDSIVPDLKNPQALNRYSYVLNNPIFYKDPNGRANIVFHVIIDFPGALLGWVLGSGPSPYTAMKENWAFDKDWRDTSQPKLAEHANAWPLYGGGYATREEALNAAEKSFQRDFQNGNNVQANHTFYDMLTHWGSQWNPTEMNWLNFTTHFVFNDIILGVLFSPIALIESVATNVSSAVKGWFSEDRGNGSAGYNSVSGFYDFSYIGSSYGGGDFISFDFNINYCSVDNNFFSYNIGSTGSTDNYGYYGFGGDCYDCYW